MQLLKTFSQVFGRSGEVQDTPRRRAIREWRNKTDVAIKRLEDEFDPLIARSVFNLRNSSVLFKLPDEIWLQIIWYIYHNKPAFFMLRQVCRRFRNMMEGPEFASHRFTSQHQCSRNYCDGQEIFCEGSGFVHAELSFFHPSLIQSRVRLWLQARVGALLRLDTLCARCAKIACTNQDNSSRCKFFQDWLHARCHAGTSGPRVKPFKNRPWRKSCVGTKGYVRLCAHQKITWKEVKQHLMKCRQMIIGDKSLQEHEIFVKECDHPSHQTGCQLSTSPRSTLVFDRSGAYTLNLYWRPHSGIGAFPSYKSGKFKASEMRDTFRQYWRYGAQFIVPEMAPGQLPEMTCFPFGQCDCLTYGDDSNTKHILYGEERESLSQRKKNGHGHKPLFRSEESHVSNLYNFACRSQVEMGCCQPSQPAETGVSPCIVTNYRRCIEGCFLVSEKAPIPSHAWLHAMDRASYHWGLKEPQSMETCNAPGCRNSYSLGMYGCYERSYDMLWAELAATDYY